MALQVDIDRLGTDVAQPQRSGAPVPVTPSGDLARVSGRENVKRAMARRMAAMRGQLLHRPEYGASAGEWVERPNTPAQRSLLAARIRRQALRDPRIRDARATVRAGTTEEGLSPSTLVVTLAYRLRDDTQDELTVAISE